MCPFEQAEPTRIVGRSLLRFHSVQLVFQSVGQFAQAPQGLRGDTLLRSRRGLAEPVPDAVASGALLEALCLAWKVGRHLAPERIKPGVSERKVEGMPPTPVKNLQKQPVLSRVQ